MCLRPAVPLALGLLLVPAALAAGAAPAPAEWPVARSEHFQVVSGTTKVGPEKMARSLEVFRDVLARRGHALRLDLAVPVHVVLVGDSEFEKLAGPFAARPAKYAGIAVLSAEHPSILVNTKDPNEDALTTAYRGLMQIALGLEKEPLPLWFREGMAEYYRTLSVHGSSVVIGQPVSGHLWTLAHTPWIPLDQFFTLDRAGLDKFSADQRTVFTAQCWALVHSQFSAGYEGKRKLAKFLDSLAARTAPEEAARTAFGTDLAGVEKRLREYARQKRFSYTVVEFDNLPTSANVAKLHESPDDVRTRMATERGAARELAGLVRSGRREAAFEYPVGGQRR